MSNSDAPQDVLRRLVSDRVASRIFKKDASLWPEPSPGGDPSEATLGWIELPAKLQDMSRELKSFAAEIRDEGFTGAVVCGMGGSSLTPAVLSAVLGTETGWLNLHVLDTVHPETISRATQSLDLSKTLFLIASKSGTTIEPLTLEAHFRDALKPDGNVERHFVALSDSGSPMAKRAQAGEFRKWFDTPGDVGGRFSALSAFGMAPAALMGRDLKTFSESAQYEVHGCRVDSEENPGLELGAFLGGNALRGRDKVTLLASHRLAPLSMWIEQLLAESTGKNNRGLVPVAGEALLDLGDYGDDRQFVYLRLDGEDNTELDRLAERLAGQGHPVAKQAIGDLSELGSQFFRWEFATAVAGHVIGTYPFDQPDVEVAKQKAREILAGDQSRPSPGTARDLTAAIGSLIESPRPGGYVAIGAFLDESEELTGAFQELRAEISKRTGMATTFGYGPRYQHSIGQLYKGGPSSVTMLILKSHGTVDLPVPGASYTLSALTTAMADGDTEAMREKGRRTEAVVMGDNPVVDVSAAVENLVQKH